MPKTWSYRKRTIDVLAPKPKGLAAAVWAYIAFSVFFVSLTATGVIYLITHEQAEDDSLPTAPTSLTSKPSGF